MSTELHPILDSARLAVTVQLARKSALTPGMPILIQGEAGTGAEELARFIHSCGDEAAVRPFVAVKCQGISEATLESELLGPSEAGTPTPAIARVRGGTLFIEEISYLGLKAQAALVSWMEGERQTSAASPPGKRSRVVVASSADLRQAVHNRAFRADLLNELSVLTLNLPPLRERKDDIIPLAEKWLAARAAVLGKTARELSPAARDKLLEHDWPENCRELQTVIERALIVEELPLIAASSVIFADRSRINSHRGSFADAFARFCSEQGRPPTLAQLECAYLVWLLELTGGNRTAASRLLGVSYPTIMKKIVDYRIDFNAIAARGRLAP